MTEQKEVTRNDLKINALLERIAHLENEKADLRVDLTWYSQQNAELQDRVKELEELVPQDTDDSSTDKN